MTLVERREAVPITSRLIEFLRTLAAASAPPVLDVDGHQEALWLSELPWQVEADKTAGAGDVVLAFDAVGSEPAPQIPSELSSFIDPEAAADSDGTVPDLRLPPEGDPDEVQRLKDLHRTWSQRWDAWAESDRRVAAARTWHRSLVRISQDLSQHGDEIELVLSVGFLTWAAPEKHIRNHLMATRCGVTLDRATGRVEVLISADGGTRLQDRRLLEDVDGFEARAADAVREEIQVSAVLPLGDQVKEQLERWSVLSLESSRGYRHDVQRQDEVGEHPEVRWAPALVVRRRDSSALTDYYDRMLESLSGDGAVAPLGLAQLVMALEPAQRMQWLDEDGAAPGSDLGDDPLFPLPANAEQAQIIGRLRGDSGVVVQGPPGTGKTHTIANLVSALLAQGQRVLVTSQKAQALRVLRDKMPAEIQDLCVSMTDVGRGGSHELSRSVNAMAEQFATYDPAAQAASIDRSAAELVQARMAEKAVSERIRALREAETYEHPEVAPGFSGRLGQIAARLRDQRPAHEWMPAVPEGAKPHPPLDRTEVGDLVDLLRGSGSLRGERLQQRVPSSEVFPAAAEVRDLIAQESAAHSSAAASRSSVSELMEVLDERTLVLVEGIEADGTAALGDLGLLAADPSPPSEDWRMRVLADGFARREQSLWSELASLGSEAQAARASLTAVGLRDVVLPTFTASGEQSATAQLSAGTALRDFLAGGGQLRRMMKPAVQKNATMLLEGSAVDGTQPVSAELLSLVLEQLSALVRADALTRRWAVVGVDIPGDQVLSRRVAQLEDHHTALAALQRFIKAQAAAQDVLRAAGVHYRIASVADWRALATSLGAVRAGLVARGASDRLQVLVDAMTPLALPSSAPPEVSDLRRALSSRDADGYEAALKRLQVAQREQRDEQRMRELLRRLRDEHPALAQLFQDTYEDGAWPTRVGGWEQAWAWGIAKSFFDHQRQPGLEQQLDGELADATARVSRSTAASAAARAWGYCLSRMTSTQATALKSYQQHITSRGKGTGRYAAVFEEAARDALAEARDAVPAWIMPLPEVLDTVPPDPNSFDVVIIDEASQASLDSLFLLWLAPRVIVVGDDRQCTPSAIGHGELQPLFDRLDEYLPDLPSYLRVAFTPKSSLFSLLQTRFGSVTRLREHFRCMPEIIDWSSRQIYADMPLIPLRQYGADRLPPIRTTHVVNGVSDGQAARLHNMIEATAIADQIAACCEDPAYAGKTMGVVVLQGRRQVDVIRDLVEQRLRLVEIEKRQIRYGVPSDFQGDERHVIFLSMVVAEQRSAQTSEDARRSYNVAASRAQDQMWLFYSVAPDLLKSTDLRRSLLDHMRNPPAPLTESTLHDVREDVPHPEFDSLFEQRVYLRIKERGYLVTPQFPVNGRLLDLVVTGPRGRLAVECDGDAFHSSPSQIYDDMERERELKRAGWRFWRVRASEFDYDPDAALEPLWARLAELNITPWAADASTDTALVSEVAVDGAVERVEEAARESDRPPALFEDEGLDGGDLEPSIAVDRWSGDASSAGQRDAQFDVDLLADQGTAAGPVGAATQQWHSDAADVRAADVREWARENGWPVNARGRLNPLVVTAFNDAHPQTPYSTASAPDALLDAGRAHGGGSPDAGVPSPGQDVSDLPPPGVIRQWARSVGLAVGERGRLHPTVIAAYREAHPES